MRGPIPVDDHGVATACQRHAARFRWRPWRGRLVGRNDLLVEGDAVHAADRPDVAGAGVAVTRGEADAPAKRPAAVRGPISFARAGLAGRPADGLWLVAAGGALDEGDLLAF